MKIVARDINVASNLKRRQIMNAENYIPCILMK